MRRLLTGASPGWLGPSLPWGRPSNQEIFRGLSTRPTSFWIASSCQTQPPVSPNTRKVSYEVALSTPTESTRTSKLILQAKLSNLPRGCAEWRSWRRGKGRVGPNLEAASSRAEWRVEPAAGNAVGPRSPSSQSILPPIPSLLCLCSSGIPESGVKHLVGVGVRGLGSELPLGNVDT